MSKRRQFCERTLKFYDVTEGERDYSINDSYIRELAEAYTLKGRRTDKEPQEVRYIKLMLKMKKVKGKKRKVSAAPTTFQQVIRRFPKLLLLVQVGISSEGNTTTLEEATKAEIKRLHDECVRLLEAHDKHKEPYNLQKAYEKLEWKTFKHSVRGTKSKEDKIADFIKGI
jgi:hypothetical protein